MAFNDVQPSSGPWFLAPGASIRIWVQYGEGDDYGAQWIMAHPLRNGQPPAELMATDHSKALFYGLGDSATGYHPDTAFYRYSVTVTNIGSSGTVFSVQGGGNV